MASEPLQQPNGRRADSPAPVRHSVPTYRDLIFDVGMHRGEDTAFYLRKGYRVVGFEANPDLVALNLERFRAEIADGRVTVVSGAIADVAEKTITFYRHPGVSAWGTTKPDWVERNTRLGEASVAIDVPVVSFAEALHEHGMPWYLKIDIEGADRHCLHVLSLFEDHPTFLSIESEKRDWDQLLAEFDVLENLGYDRFAAVQQSSLNRRIRALRTRTLTGAPLRHRFENSASGPFGEDVQDWAPRDEVVARYRRIFKEYRLVGDQSLLRRTRAGIQFLEGLGRIVHRPLPGWYDTHATRHEELEAIGAGRR
jgi:FkbM family methyltransferase